jgi:hypothetical protein
MYPTVNACAAWPVSSHSLIRGSAVECAADDIVRRASSIWPRIR